ncbi:uncharacterized protein [Temnothorax nylanderi]|uniref:uncharacterized protein isoform X3 n=1 Tax=Temnothorax nylanderi TaxID=102681 RepID=UPI003A8C0E66
MKRLIFVLYLCSIALTVNIGIGDVTDRVADVLSMSKTDVQICFNKTNVNVADLLMMDQLINDDVETPDINNSALKVGCLFACLLQKKELMVGTYIDIEKVKKELDKKARNDDNISIRNRILDNCIEQDNLGELLIDQEINIGRLTEGRSVKRVRHNKMRDKRIAEAQAYLNLGRHTGNNNEAHSDDNDDNSENCENSDENNENQKNDEEKNLP